MIKSHLKKHLLALAIIGSITCLIFFKIFLKGLYPIPADLLVSFYFPFKDGGWEGYNPWTTRKELLGADSIRQIYLWKEFAASQIKVGKFPNWSPYTFAGQPLSANFQSSVYYPFNLFYLVTTPQNAWILLIVLQPFLAGVLMYFAAKSFNLKFIPSIFAGVAFMFSSYLVTWMENGNISHSYLWLPGIIWAINNYFSSLKYRHLFYSTIFLTLSILGGHPQTAIYLFLLFPIYFIFKAFLAKSLKKHLVFVLVPIVLSLLISAAQLIPTYDFYRQSPISLPFASVVFKRSILPYKNLVTFFASDFFGHPANNNYWSQSYGDFTPYIGVVPLIFSLWAGFRLRKEKIVQLLILVSAIFVLASTEGPITYLIKTFQIPLLNSTTPSRFLSVSLVFLIILSAMGLEDFLKNLKNKNYQNSLIKFCLILGVFYIALWSFAVLGPKFLKPTDFWQTNLAVTKRNLILPTLMFASVLFTPIFFRLVPYYKSYLQKLLIAGIFISTIIGGIYYTNKFLPMSPKNYIFPDHPIFTYLKENGGINRFFGQGTARVDFNFPTHYQLFTPEGYDTLRYERYAQLLASSFTGKVPESYLRSDAVFPQEENGYRKRLFELLGVKYFVDKEDYPKTGADWNYGRFPNDEVKGIWQEGRFQVYERTNVLPRAFLTTQYEVVNDKDQIIEKIYDTNFDLKTLLLEEQPSITVNQNKEGTSIPYLKKYEPSNVVFETNTNGNSLLFLSDAFDKDWEVEIDSQKTKLLRAHFALRAVAVPVGKHTVKFKYVPSSFKLGLFTTTISLVTLGLLSIYVQKKKLL